MFYKIVLKFVLHFWNPQRPYNAVLHSVFSDPVSPYPKFGSDSIRLHHYGSYWCSEGLPISFAKWWKEAGEKVHFSSSVLVSDNIFLKILAALLVSILLLIGGAGSTIGSTLIYSLERGSEGISMPFDEASLAGKSCNLDIFISFLTHNCVNPSDYLSHWQHYWIICRRLDLHFNWSQKDYNFVLHSLMWFLATFGLRIKWSDGSFIYVFDGHIYFNPKDICG